jgi:hypothetical protein
MLLTLVASICPDPTVLQSDLVLYLDSSASTSQACVPPSNPQANGKIVVVREVVALL